MIYIWKTQNGYYVETEDPIDEEYWAGQIGSTYQDFLDGKWVLLSNDQIAFHEEHPDASINEVLNMELNPPYIPERTLEQAKLEKKKQLLQYDSSPAVNSFSINGNEMWLNVEERQQIATQISANEAIGRKDMTRWFNGIEFTFPITTWKQMLTALEVYAGDALNVTEAHKAAIDTLESIEDVDNYDYTLNYPDKINF